MGPFVFQLTPTSVLKVAEGDITRVHSDAIVNAANSRMLGGGGVDGAIHHAAGPQLLAACREVPEVAPGVRCPEGEARITPGFQLPSDYVIHTVGPVYVSPEVSAPVLTAAYRSSLELANEHQLRSIAFPAVSCGVFGYPLEEAARVAIAACQAHVQRLQEVQFILFGSESFSCWKEVAAELLVDASQAGHAS